MTYTSHGHHIPGSDRTDEAGQVPKARCGGPAICTVCQKDTARFLTPDTPDPEIEEFFKDLDEYPDPDVFMKRAKLFVVSAYNNRITDLEVQLSIDDLEIVAFTKIGENWKALVKTIHPGDGFYFEVEYHADKEATHVETFLQLAHDTFSQEGNE